MTEAPKRRSFPRAALLLLFVAILFVLVPFLFWRQTWFGRRLSDGEIGLYLEKPTSGRRVQHAMVQLSERMAAGDRSVRRHYPGLVGAAGSRDAAVRNLAAWTMGQDPGSPLLHDGLLRLLSDPDLEVRRNAALSLVRFGDASGRSELVSMLRPHEVRTVRGGAVRLLVKPKQEVGAGVTVARLVRDGGEELAAAPFRSEVSAVLVSDGARVEPGGRLIALAPREEEVWEAMRALYLVGDAADLPDIDRYGSGTSGMPDRIARQARLTAAAIRSRQAPSSSR